MKKIFLLVLLLGGMGLTETPASRTVTIDNFVFQPMTLEITRGTTVTWVNRDDIPHVVASTTGLFKSRALDTDASFSYTFTAVGSYEYFCSVHPKMTGKIVVK